jgi:hypothetical protein
MVIARIYLTIAGVATLNVTLRSKPLPLQNSDIESARIELLVLRTAVAKGSARLSDSVRFYPVSTLMSADSAISLLAHRRKPAVCSAKVVQGALNLTCDDFLTLSGEEVAAHLLVKYNRNYGEVPEAFRLAKVAPLSLVVGSDSIVIATQSFVNWTRDYMLPWEDSTTYDVSVHVVADHLTSDDPQAGDPFVALARQRGARAAVVFSHSVSASESILTAPPVEPNDDRLARLAESLLDLDLGADGTRLRPALLKIAKMFGAHFQGKPLPPSVSDFLGHYALPEQ